MSRFIVRSNVILPIEDDILLLNWQMVRFVSMLLRESIQLMRLHCFALLTGQSTSQGDFFHQLKSTNHFVIQKIF